MAGKKRKEYSADFKIKVVIEALKSPERLAALAKTYKVSLPSIRGWTKRFLDIADQTFNRTIGPKAARKMLAGFFELVMQTNVTESSGLGKREKTVLAMFLKDQKDMKTIAQDMHCTYERARTIYIGALRKLKYGLEVSKRRHKKIKELKDAIQNLERENHALRQLAGKPQMEEPLTDAPLGIMKTDILEMNLSVRLRRILTAQQIRTVGDLQKWDRERLLRVRDFGLRTLLELEDVLRERGIEWRSIIAAPGRHEGAQVVQDKEIAGLNAGVQNQERKNHALKQLSENHQMVGPLTDAPLNIMKTDILEMDLSVRLRRLLTAQQIRTVGDLQKWDRGRLLKIRGFGARTLSELQDVLQERGIDWGSVLPGLVQRDGLMVGQNEKNADLNQVVKNLKRQNRRLTRLLKNRKESNFLNMLTTGMMNVDILEMDISARLRSVLIEAQIRTVGDLQDRYYDHLVKILDFGTDSLSELKKVLAKYGVYWRPGIQGAKRHEEVDKNLSSLPSL